MNKIYFLILFSVSVFVYSQDFATRTGEIIVDSQEDSFSNAVIQIQLYEYDSLLRGIINVLRDQIIVRNFSHIKGEETTHSFVIGDKVKSFSEEGYRYYIIVKIYSHNTIATENAIFIGKNPHDNSHLLQEYDENIKHFIFKAKKLQHYSDEQNYPLSYTSAISSIRYTGQTFGYNISAFVKGRIIIYQDRFKVNNNGLDIYFEIENMKEKKVYFDMDMSNINKKEIIFSVNELEIEISGVRTFTISSSTNQPNYIHLKPGESYKWKLITNQPEIIRYWEQPGNYFVKFIQKCYIKNAQNLSLRDSFFIFSPNIPIYISE